MEITKKIIIEHIKTIQDEYKNQGIVTIALFGSFATDSQGVYSDIDIAIKKQNDFFKTNPYKYFEVLNSLKANLQAKFHRNIDITDLDSKSSFLNNIQKDIIYV
jgi:predicted nucleotidyltransferase